MLIFLLLQTGNASLSPCHGSIFFAAVHDSFIVSIILIAIFVVGKMVGSTVSIIIVALIVVGAHIVVVDLVVVVVHVVNNLMQRF